MKNLIRVGALLLCVLFFTLPLVQCSQDSSYTASGWEIATGTGKLFSERGKGYPLAFLLIIIPAVLLIASFLSNSFAVLRNISITGLLAKIVFLIYANSLLSSGEYKGAFELTGFNWLVFGIYIGLCAIAFYCAKSEGEDNYVQRGTANKKCRQCGTIFSCYATFCPKCNSEYTDQSINTTNSPITPINTNYGDTWTCKKCNEINPKTSPKCKGCGSYI
jgi:ribosomal protein L40E